MHESLRARVVREEVQQRVDVPDPFIEQVVAPQDHLHVTKFGADTSAQPGVRILRQARICRETGVVAAGPVAVHSSKQLTEADMRAIFKTH